MTSYIASNYRCFICATDQMDLGSYMTDDGYRTKLCLPCKERHFSSLLINAQELMVLHQRYYYAEGKKSIV